MKKKSPKQLAALICVILLVSMYIVTFIAACLDTTNSGRLFAACLVVTIVLPVLFWIMLWFYGLWKERQTEALASLPDKEDSSGTDQTDHIDLS